jgi:hypothetical protein
MAYNTFNLCIAKLRHRNREIESDRNYTKSYIVSILFGGYVYITENSPVPSCMLFCSSPYPYGLCKSLIEEELSAGM